MFLNHLLSLFAKSRGRYCLHPDLRKIACGNCGCCAYGTKLLTKKKTNEIQLTTHRESKHRRFEKETIASVGFVLLFKLEIESCFIFIFLSRCFSRKLRESLSQAFQLLTDGLTHFKWNSSMV